MDNIYIFGDSFFCRWVEDNVNYSWILQLTKKYSVCNYSIPGASNQEIYLSFLKNIDIITSNDVVLLGWSEPNRFYVNPEVTKNDKIYEMYHKNFYNKTLVKLQYQSFMSEVKKTIKEKNIKTLFFWSFPSDYIDPPKENANWLDAILSNINETNYQYLDSFENEVKPALIYFSKKEVEHFTSQDEIVNYFRKKDRRPNHISNEKIHNELVKIVIEFIENKIDGQIDLIERLNNGA